MTTVAVDRDAIEATWEVIGPHIRVTPVIEVDGADFGIADISLCFKLEQLQHSGSFKVRGAFANLLMRKLPEAGVVAASGGSHGVAVAYAARQLGIRGNHCREEPHRQGGDPDAAGASQKREHEPLGEQLTHHARAVGA